MIVFDPQKDLLRETVTSNKVLEKTIQMAMEAKNPQPIIQNWTKIT